MRQHPHDMAEKARVRDGAYGTNRGDTFGHFKAVAPSGAYLFVMAADGTETRFDHVSVSVLRDKDGTHKPDRCPTWEEMVWVKSLFWDDEECVIEYHPPRSKYVNNHNYVLHLWKPLDAEIPLPPSICV